MIRDKILTPFQKFVKIESFSGILLFSASVIAILWANSSYGESYEALWNFQLGIRTEDFELYKPLILWVNDGLMAIFFFLIGLEVKREILLGELNSLKKLTFPLAGAVGGILFPVLVFLLLNKDPQATAGWGIPMATDIAFALAIIKLLGDRVPLSLKVFLTAFAIVDDIGAVLVIALFYSKQIYFSYLMIALILLIMIYLITYLGRYSKFLTILVAIVVWFLFLKAGVHPTLAGVLMAFSIPIRQVSTTPEFVNKLWDITKNIKDAQIEDSPLLTKVQLEYVEDLKEWVDHYQSPLQKLENRLHDWVAYLIIPVFALANAGVVIGGEHQINMALAGIIILALVVGKSVGITLVVYLAKRSGIVTLPDDITWRHIIGVSFIAGVGFTMSIFIAGLAFAGHPAYIDSAKIGILVGSLIAGIIGFGILKYEVK